jgi:3-dehydroquinate dehydratase-2
MGDLPRILVLNGPNLNMLGSREPGVYGTTTLADISREMEALAAELGLELEFFQSNHEGALVDKIQEAYGKVAGIIINPAAYTHTSVAVRDALLLHAAPVVEIHISNIFKREPFRHKSLVSDIAAATLCGFGKEGYMLALRGMAVLAGGWKK